MAETGTKRRQSPRRGQGSKPAPGPSGQEADSGQSGSEGAGSGGAKIEFLDPKIITWPEGRITSDYDEEQSAALRASMAKLGQQDAVGVVQLEDGTFEGAAGMNRCKAAIESGTEQILCKGPTGTW